jgi:hypothetical protein
MSVPWDSIRSWSVESAGSFDRDVEVKYNLSTDLVSFLRTVDIDIILERFIVQSTA